MFPWRIIAKTEFFLSYLCKYIYLGNIFLEGFILD